MTEKRFTYKYNGHSSILFDNKYHTFFHIEDSEENIELFCNRLNELAEAFEENQMLKNDISGYNANYEIIKEKQVIFISGVPFISIHKVHKFLDEILHKELIKLDKEMREQ